MPVRPPPSTLLLLVACSFKATSRTFDDGTHNFVKVNPNSLALLSASERVAYLQWLSIVIVPYLSGTAPGRVRLCLLGRCRRVLQFEAMQPLIDLRCAMRMWAGARRSTWPS